MTEQVRAYLSLLADELAKDGWPAELLGGVKPVLEIRNPDVPTLTSRVSCRLMDEAAFVWASSGKDIAPMTDLARTAEAIKRVIRTVVAETK